MSDEGLLLTKPPQPEPTQPAPHPKEHKRATKALWISCIAAFFALLAAIGSIWQAYEVRRSRLQAESSTALVQRVQSPYLITKIVRNGQSRKLVIENATSNLALNVRAVYNLRLFDPSIFGFPTKGKATEPREVTIAILGMYKLLKDLRGSRPALIVSALGASSAVDLQLFGNVTLDLSHWQQSATLDTKIVVVGLVEYDNVFSDHHIFPFCHPLIDERVPACSKLNEFVFDNKLDH